MELHENALLAFDTILQKPARGIPCTGINVMEHRMIDRLAGEPEGTYRQNPVDTYLKMQLNIGACLIVQWIPNNPLSMGAHGFAGDAKKGATTGADRIVCDGILIDSPEAVVDHLERFEFPRCEHQCREFDEHQVANDNRIVAKIIAQEKQIQNTLGPSILKSGYGFIGFPALHYGRYGYENYFMAYALYPEVVERHFKLQADICVRHNRAAARAYLDDHLPPQFILDHDMADSRGTLVDIKSLDKIWFPHFARSIKPLLDAGVKMIWHCDGNLMQMVPRLLEAGLHGFQGFQYEDGMDYDKICRMKTRDGNSLIIWAGVSVTRTLPFGKPEDVRKEMKWLVENGPKTGLFLSCSSSMAPGVPWENIQALVEGFKYYRQHGRNDSGAQDGTRLTSNEAPPKQLQMIYPAEKLAQAPEPILTPGYQLRQYRLEDEKAYLNLMAKAGFKNWTRETLESWLKKALPDGLFVIIHEPTRRIVATAMASHNPRPEMPFGGELGWVAGDPEHAGHGLGQAVCAAVVRRFAQAGYCNVYLLTDDFRLPAIKVYLKLGFKPFIYLPDMEARWQKICAVLKWPFEPMRINK